MSPTSSSSDASVDGNDGHHPTADEDLTAGIDVEARTQSAGSSSDGEDRRPSPTPTVRFHLGTPEYSDESDDNAPLDPDKDLDEEEVPEDSPFRNEHGTVYDTKIPDRRTRIGQQGRKEIADALKEMQDGDEAVKQVVEGRQNAGSLLSHMKPGGESVDEDARPSVAELSDDESTNP